MPFIPETDQRGRVVIEGVSPEIDGGRFPIKRICESSVTVEADIFCDGHDAIAARLLSRFHEDAEWRESRMRPLLNDRWRGEFSVARLGEYRYTVLAWIDRFATWQRDFRKRITAGQSVDIDRQIGAGLIERTLPEVTLAAEREILSKWMRRLHDVQGFQDVERFAEDDELTELMRKHAPRTFAVTYEKQLRVVVERKRAQFSAWYEFFPRSAATEPGRHGTLEDCEARLESIAAMGFDVVYLPPIHPIGRVHRKGKNNSPEARPDDVGSPWAIGAEEGGHKSIHPQLGTLEDFRRLVQRAQDYGLEVAMDIALQCAPDHPYVRDHPEWFLHRPDGTIQYAENPPKKYQDIYPIHFETENWRELWAELYSIFEFWIDQGVKIFRVDNPHTKPFPFWEWVIAELRKKTPEVIFLSEAFTRPKVMYRLAKLGFSQSYTYFAWRRTKYELTEYLTEVTRPGVANFFRPNLWPNTPDILTEQLQIGNRATYQSRAVLAATLGANYGIYGPAFELMEREPREFGGEEYRDSEKYQIRRWDWQQPDSLRDFLARLNRIRNENPALHGNRSLMFHQIENEQLLCYSKHTEDFSNVIVVVVNLDSHYVQSGFVELPLDLFDLDAARPYQVHDLLSGARYLWHGPRNYLELNPKVVPAHIFRLRRHVRTERDFDYYL